MQAETEAPEISQLNGLAGYGLGLGAAVVWAPDTSPQSVPCALQVPKANLETHWPSPRAWPRPTQSLPPPASASEPPQTAVHCLVTAWPAQRPPRARWLSSPLLKFSEGPSRALPTTCPQHLPALPPGAVLSRAHWECALLESTREAMILASSPVAGPHHYGQLPDPPMRKLEAKFFLLITQEEPRCGAVCFISARAC